MDGGPPPTDERRRVVLAGCAATAAVAGAIYGLVYALVGAWICGLGALVCMVGAGSIGLWSRRPGIALRPAAEALTGVVWLTLVIVVAGSGGLDSTALGWLTVVPVLATLNASWTSAGRWTAVCGTTVIVFAVGPQPGQLPPWFAPVFDVLSPVGLLIFVWVLVGIFERARQAELFLRADVARREAQEVALREAVEAAEVASRIKNAFLANMSHEIRTPLNGVTGSVELLRQTQLDGPQTDLLQTLEGASQVLLRVVNDILDLTELESGRLTMGTRPMPLVETIERVVASHRATAKAKGLELQTGETTSPERWVLADPARLAQVLGNLVENALKFTHRGEVKVAWHLESGELELNVVDTGPGIAPEKLELIFEAFEQADSSMTRKFGGTGLGLAISRRLAELMGGSLAVKSELGRGSTFVFRLPVETVDAPPAFDSARPPSSDLDDLQLEILVAEDNATNQTIVKRMLSSLTVSVTIVDNGAEAVKAVSRTRFDLILMDVQMPEMDGLEATLRIRELEAKEGRAPIPILALSANASPSDRARCRDSGMNDFLAKPYRRQDLFRMVRSWCSS